MSNRLKDRPIKGMGCFIIAIVLIFSFTPAWGSLTFPIQGAISPPGDLDVSHRTPRVAVDYQGNAYALWVDHRNGQGDIYFSYKPVGGSWSPNVRVNDDTGGYKQTSPCIAVDANRNAFALWVDYRNGNPDIYFSYRPVGGAWGANVRVNDDGGTKNQFSPALAVDGNGTAYAIWEDYRQENGDLYFSFLPVGSGWQANIKVTDDPGNTNQVTPSIAVDAARNVYAVWMDYRNGKNQIFFSYRPSGGSWQANTRVDDDAAGADKYAPVVAVDPNGNACAVWEDSRLHTIHDIFSAYRPNGGAWGANLKVNDDTSGYGHYNPTVAAINLSGLYIFWAAWGDFRNGHADVYGSFFDTVLSFLWTPNGKHPTTADTAQQVRPALGVGPASNACILWEDYRNNHWEIFGSCQPPFGAWEEDLRVNDDSAGTAVQYEPAIALDHQGNAFLVRRESRNGTRDIYFTYRPSGGPWGPALKINDDGGTASRGSPAIAVDKQGKAYAIWEDYRNGNNDIYFSSRSSGGNWEQNVRVNDDTGPFGQYAPSIAVDGQGNAYAVWQDGRSVYTNIYFAYRPSGGSWGPNGRVNDDTVPANHNTPSIAVDGQGNAFAVWRDLRGSRDNVYFSYRPAGGVWGANARVSEDLDFYRLDPVIAVDKSGNAHAVWEETRFPNSNIYYAFRPAGGNWGANVRIKEGQGTVNQFDPSMAIDGAGRVVVVWVEHRAWHWDLYGATRTPGGPWELLDRINRDSGQEDKYQTKVAVNNAGQIAVVWEDYAYWSGAVFYALSGSQMYLPLILK